MQNTGCADKKTILWKTALYQTRHSPIWTGFRIRLFAKHILKVFLKLCVQIHNL